MNKKQGNNSKDNLIVKELKEKFPKSILNIYTFAGDITVTVSKDDLLEIAHFLRDHPKLKITYVSSISGVDYLERKPRFEVVYHIYSLEKNHRIGLKVQVDEDESIPSVTPIWAAADWFEREIYDMYGVPFEGHPNLSRLLMPDDWVGHPLRKDYPLRPLDE